MASLSGYQIDELDKVSAQAYKQMYDEMAQMKAYQQQAQTNAFGNWAYTGTSTTAPSGFGQALSSKQALKSALGKLSGINPGVTKSVTREREVTPSAVLRGINGLLHKIAEMKGTI